MKYKVGDRVRVKSWEEMAERYGLDGAGAIDMRCGFPINMKEFCGKEYTIRMKHLRSYHLFGADSWHFTDEMLDPVSTNRSDITKVTIYREGNTVIAVDPRTKERAEARCSPEDTFDFAVGAKLALDRLLTAEPLYNGKVVCINHDGMDWHWTLGRIYQFVNGCTIDDCGDKFPWEYAVHNCDELNKLLANVKFIEVVE